MNHDKIFKREDGTCYKIAVHLHLPGLTCHEYRLEVWVKQPRKRTWFRTCKGDDYAYRKLSMEDRRKFKAENNLKFVTEAEILETKRELWEKLKPV